MGLVIPGGKSHINLYFAAVVALALTVPMSVIFGFVLCYLGLAGHFEFTANLKGLSFALAGASPGLFFVVCAPILWWVLLDSKLLPKLMSDPQKPSETSPAETD